jgi:uncharacterized membrane protein YeaQ/YmgE (transglycosylase-associated protein family)
MTLMTLVSWIALGLIAGAIAKAIYPGQQGGGIVATTLLGIFGAIIGGWLGNAIFSTTPTAAGIMSLSSIMFAILGAIVLLMVWGFLSRRTA